MKINYHRVNKSLSRCLLLLFCLNISNGVFAISEQNHLVKFLIVWEKQGGVISFPLETQPCLTFNVENASVKCTTTEKEVSFSMNDIHKYTLEETSHPSLGLQKTTSEEGCFNQTSDQLQLRNYSPHSQVSVYRLDGKLFEQHEVDENGHLLISTQNWEKGIYIVKQGKVAYKIMKK